MTRDRDECLVPCPPVDSAITGIQKEVAAIKESIRGMRRTTMWAVGIVVAAFMTVAGWAGSAMTKTADIQQAHANDRTLHRTQVEMERDAEWRQQMKDQMDRIERRLNRDGGAR